MDYEQIKEIAEDEEQANVPEMEIEEHRLQQALIEKDRRFLTQAEIPEAHKDDLNPYGTFHGHHIALSNLSRGDNLIYTGWLDCAYAFDRLAITRDLAKEVMEHALTLSQLQRANPKIGGFEREMQSSIIRRTDMDIGTKSITLEPSKKKRWFGR